MKFPLTLYGLTIMLLPSAGKTDKYMFCFFSVRFFFSLAVRMAYQQFEWYVFFIFACVDVSFPGSVYITFYHSKWNFIPDKMTVVK